MSSSKRHFTVVEGSKEHGLYISSSPSSAARKIVSKLCSSNKSKKVQFFIREITQGSKKKTYGPYLGEMKKLAKPIELKGRVIKYAPSVYLDKKKSAKNNVKKNGDKMKGGFSFLGFPEAKDFFIRNISKNTIQQSNIISGSGYGNKHEFKDNIEIEFVNLKRNSMNKKFLFFSPNDSTTKNFYKDFIRYYKYLACTTGFGIFKKAIFYKAIIVENFSNMQEINISTIEKEDLEKLKVFIEEQQKQDETFCSKIYKAILQELLRRLNEVLQKTEKGIISIENLLKNNSKKLPNISLKIYQKNLTESIEYRNNILQEISIIEERLRS